MFYQFLSLPQTNIRTNYYNNLLHKSPIMNIGDGKLNTNSQGKVLIENLKELILK